MAAFIKSIHKFVGEFIRSFVFAKEGIVYALKTQNNLRIDFFLGIIVLILSLILPLSSSELIWVIFSVFIVIVFEMLNSMIEELLDLFYPYFHEKVKRIKDIAAGVVLLAAIFACSIGLIILGKHMIKMPDNIGIFAFIVFLISFFSTIIKGVRYGKNKSSHL